MSTQISLHVNAEVFQYDGVGATLDHIQSNTDVGTIITTPDVFEDTGDTGAVRLPPLDIDGRARVLDRPLAGAVERFGTRRFAFPLPQGAFSDTPYRPPLEHHGDDILSTVADEVRRRGLRFGFLMNATCPPGLAPTDTPVLPDGTHHRPAIADVGCPNNPAVRNYAVELLRQIVGRYAPDVVILNWLEYTVYRLRDNFTCFCVHCERRAGEEGTDFARMRRTASALLAHLGALNAAEADRIPQHGAWDHLEPGIADLFAFKARSVANLVRTIRHEVDAVATRNCEIRVASFAPPMSDATGVAASMLTSEGYTVMPKLFRFHWSLMTGWYAKDLAVLNPSLDEASRVTASLALLGLPRAPVLPLDEYRMPTPTEFGHPRLETEAEKYGRVLAVAPIQRVVPFMHSYGPEAMVAARMRIASNFGFPEVHMQRYGYLSDEKLRLLRNRAT